MKYVLFVLLFAVIYTALKAAIRWMEGRRK